MRTWIVDFDDRPDSGPLRVGPFDTKHLATSWLARQDFDYAGASVLPVDAPP